MSSLTDSNLITTSVELDAMLFELFRQKHDVGASLNELLAKTSLRMQHSLHAFERVGMILGTKRAADTATYDATHDATTRAVVECCLHPVRDRRRDALEHLRAILRVATRGLFLPVEDTKVKRADGGMAFEGAKWETARWLEDWLWSKLIPWRAKPWKEIVAAAERGEFRYWGHACRRDLLDEVRKQTGEQLGPDGEKVQLVDENEIDWDRSHGVWPVERFDPSEYLRLATDRNLGDFSHGVRAYLLCYGHGDIAHRQVLAKLESILNTGPDGARRYLRWFQKNIEPAVHNYRVLQDLRDELRTAGRPALTVPACEKSEEDGGEDSGEAGE